MCKTVVRSALPFFLFFFFFFFFFFLAWHTCHCNIAPSCPDGSVSVSLNQFIKHKKYQMEERSTMKCNSFFCIFMCLRSRQIHHSFFLTMQILVNARLSFVKIEIKRPPSIVGFSRFFYLSDQPLADGRPTHHSF